MNNELMFSSKSDEWSTPQDFWDKINEEFHFKLDACATEENAKCERYFTIEDNGLTQKWESATWINPPYSAVKDWVAKAYWQMLDYNILSVMLIPARTDTRYFHDWIWDAANHKPRKNIEVRFLKGRLKFGGSKNSAPFPSMLVVFNP